MKLAFSILMLFAVLITLFSPVHIAPAQAGGSDSIMTLDVCSTAGSGTVATGDITFIPQSAVAAPGICCSVPVRAAESIISISVFTSGIERPPQA